MVNKLKAVAYVRTATESMEDEYKINAQLDAIKRYADVHGIEIVAEYKDLGQSGNNTVGRPGFKSMLDNLVADTTMADYVLVSKLSRFGRNSACVVDSVKKLQNCGVNLICTEDRLDTGNETGRLLVSVLSVIAGIDWENEDEVDVFKGRKFSGGEW